MTPTYTATDLKRIAAHFNMSVKAFKEKWLMQDEDNKDWVNKTTPCQFLNLKTNKCSIYEIRPLDCSQFPHHHKKPFEFYNDTFSQNLDKCPATNELVLQLEKRIKQDYVW
jgi:Fe-S-cluster containining protein